jgi:hypothetical protein
VPTGPRPHTPENVVRVAVTGLLGSQPYANIFHAFLPANAISSDAQLLTWLQSFRASLNSSGLYTARHSSLHVTLLDGVMFWNQDLVFRAQETTNIIGTAVTQQEPASAAVCLSWHTSAFWRGGKPRTYIGGITATQLDTNHSLLDSEKTAILGQAQSLITMVNGITTPQVPETHFCFVHYQSKNVWLNPPTTFNITGVSVHDRLASQRRRLGPWLP